MSARRRHAWVGFAVFGILAALALFVLDGAAAGVASLLAMIAFIIACINVLRGEDHRVTAESDKVGLRGWVGHWF